MTTNSHVDKKYAKTDSYREELERIEEVGGCPFCESSPSFTFDPEIQPIIHRNKYWLVVKVREGWEYENTKLHYLIVNRRHVEHFLQLKVEDMLALDMSQRWLIEHFGVDGGGFAMRFGPTRYTGASVNHLHVHFIVPEIDPETDRARVVNFPFG